MSRQSTSLFQSFNFAAEGIVHAVRTQRNLWIHFALAVVVLLAAIGFGATKLELAVLLLAITFVLVAELVNTAVEAAVDVASTSFDPMAKIAKDIAAGAVLIAALNAVAVGYLVFSGEVATRSSRFLTHPVVAVARRREHEPVGPGEAGGHLDDPAPVPRPGERAKHLVHLDAGGDEAGRAHAVGHDEERQDRALDGDLERARVHREGLGGLGAVVAERALLARPEQRAQAAARVLVLKRALGLPLPEPQGD